MIILFPRVLTTQHSILMHMNKIIAIVAVVLGVVCIGLALFYWMTPAGSLPTYMPGYEVGSSIVHFKHGLAALILGLGLFAFAWFKSAPSKSSQ